MRPQFFCLITAIVAAPSLLSRNASAQIQRCESAGGAITYANECPSGTKAVKSLSAVPQPSAEAQEAARKQVQRDQAAARQTDERARQRQAQASAEEAQRRAADCGYMRAEIDSVRRMKNMLTTRPYYSLDDVEQMEKHAVALSADYQRVCG